MKTWPAADREAAEAARLLPDAPQPPYVLGLIARAENRTDDALREFERVRRIDGDDAGTNVNLGQMFLEQRRYDEAIAVLRRAVSLEPYNVTAVYNLGLALTRAGQESEGRRALEQAQALRSVGYAVTFGNGYLEQGRYAEAIASTGAEPELVDAAPSRAMFTATVDRRRCLAPAAVVAVVRRRRRRRSGPASPRRPPATVCSATTAAGAGPTPPRPRFGPASGEALAAVAGDYDNDGRTDLFVARSRRKHPASQRGERPVRRRHLTRRLADCQPAGNAAWADVDHDGDLDLDRRFADRPRSSLLRNNGNGTFTDTTAAPRSADARCSRSRIVPTDFDNRRDLDLLVVNAAGAPALFRNRRDGTFLDVAGETDLSGLGMAAQFASATVGDINKDDFPDLVFFGPNGDSMLALSDGRGRFRSAPAPEAMRGSTAAQLLDYDNDGLLDLVVWSSGGGRLFRTRWRSVDGRDEPGDAFGVERRAAESRAASRSAISTAMGRPIS